MSEIIFEACVESLAAAISSEKHGAKRIELCADLSIGGITPDYGLIEACLENLKIPVNVLIRPRGGGFIYSEEELEIMKRDIIFCRMSGAHGAVIGILREDGLADMKRLSEMIELARPMSVTFHRAFDVAGDPIAALDSLIELGINRLLTSGQKSDAYSGIDTIRRLVERAEEKIIIMPGGGINENNIRGIIKETGVKEIHGSARTTAGSGANSKPDFSAEKLSAMIKAINEFQH